MRRPTSSPGRGRWPSGASGWAWPRPERSGHRVLAAGWLHLPLPAHHLAVRAPRPRPPHTDPVAGEAPVGNRPTLADGHGRRPPARWVDGGSGPGQRRRRPSRRLRAEGLGERSIVLELRAGDESRFPRLGVLRPAGARGPRASSTGTATPRRVRCRCQAPRRSPTIRSQETRRSPCRGRRPTRTEDRRDHRLRRDPVRRRRPVPVHHLRVHGHTDERSAGSPTASPIGSGCRP